MRKDYSITIFSRHKGKTFSFHLDRRVIYVPLVILIVLVVSCVLLGQFYFQEREERQRLEGRIALLEQLMDKFEARAERQGGEVLSQGVAKPAPQPTVEVALVPKEEEKKPEPPVPEIRVGSNAEVDPRPIARIDEAKVSFLEEDREGFRFVFKLVNLIDEPIAGNVAIIAALRPPHQPRFVSFPSMKLNDGLPVKLRKSVGYSIRYFKEVTGRFYFPFSYSESFRILIYDRDEEVVLDSTLLAKDVAVHGLQLKEPAPSGYPSEVSEPSEPFEPTGPTDPSLSS
ncbi:MAG: hypothetical protein PVH34_03945 [Syntrophobacterales bacterium]|jgi:hypothetical protein